MAIFSASKGYKDHCLDLQNGDSLYLFSDGIIHQFGGGNGRKKFSLKQLTDLLEHHANHDLEHIKATTDKAFNDWKAIRTRRTMYC
ncbi:MAG: SpoIIE family protein phosphatase [Flavobacteriales bacterium]|nr:SpoIIE family protein phosphatase [Flavobacteriales bacterium]